MIRIWLDFPVRAGETKEANAPKESRKMVTFQHKSPFEVLAEDKGSPGNGSNLIVSTVSGKSLPHTMMLPFSNSCKKWTIVGVQ